VIHVFHVYDGLMPSALTLKSGVLYGTTLLGGTSRNCDYGCGVVYKLVLNTRAFTVLHSFDASGGSFPDTSLTPDKTGKFLYGATPEGGTSGNCNPDGCGVVFRLTIRTGAYDVLYNFTGSPDAEYPYGLLSMDSSGNLYGDSQLGGSSPCRSAHGCGTVFMVDPRERNRHCAVQLPRRSARELPDGRHYAHSGGHALRHYCVGRPL
jgi:uncharacterized repeat protein (TIGR03803 family)